MTNIDFKTHLLVYIMAVGIGSAIYVPIFVLGGAFVALFKKLPLLIHLKKMIILGIIVGSGTAIKKVRNDTAQYNQERATAVQIQKPSSEVVQSKNYKRQLQEKLSAIIEIVKNDPLKADAKTRTEFQRYLSEYTDGDAEHVKTLKFNF